MSRLLGRALGSVVSPVVDCVDVDGVVRRIDVDHLVQQIDLNDLLERVDLNSLLDRVDVNRHLDRVDANRHLDRVDFNRHLERVDMDEIVRRSNLEEIVARSTSGIFSHVLDAVRTQIMLVDENIHRIARCTCCGKVKFLPPTPVPGMPSQYDIPYPIGASRLAVASQGRSAGFLSRCVAWAIDGIVISLCFSLILIIINALIQIIKRDEDFEMDQDNWVIPVAFSIWSFLYNACSLAVVGKTFGKAILGILVVRSNNGSQITAWQAGLRSLFFPVSFFTVVGIVLGLFRRDRRQLQDFVACTWVVYDWDAKMARLRKKAMADQERILPLNESTLLAESKTRV